MNKWICDICNDDLYNHFVLARGQKLSKKSCLASPTCMRKNCLALVAGQWISVKERLPKPDTMVLILKKPSDRYQSRIELRWLECEDRWESNDYATPYVRLEDEIITHWMPLPDLPRDKHGS